MLNNLHSLKEKEILSSIEATGPEFISSRDLSKKLSAAVIQPLSRLKCSNSCVGKWTLNTLVQSHGSRIVIKKLQIHRTWPWDGGKEENNENKAFKENKPTFLETKTPTINHMYHNSYQEHHHLLTLGDKYTIASCDLSDLTQFKQII